MLAHSPVEAPITGDEDLGDLSRPQQALAQFYRAFNARDLTLMTASWEPSDEAAMDNPLGGITRGWPQIRAVGRERGRCETRQGPLDLAIRTTRIFRRVDGRWRQVHHHGSMDDPIRLAAYQSAIRAENDMEEHHDAAKN